MVHLLLPLGKEQAMKKDKSTNDQQKPESQELERDEMSEILGGVTFSPEFSTKRINRCASSSSPD